jgi:hypothetical protein
VELKQSRLTGAWTSPARHVRVRGRTLTPANIVACVIFLFMALRLCFACSTQPMIGYANNLDFFRQSACVGVWQATGGERISSHVESPVNDLVRDGVRISSFCMASSDNLFVWLAAQRHKLNTPFPLQEVGSLKAMLTIALTGLMLLQPIGASARLASAVMASLVFGDIAVGCYFNTLYVDASAIVSATLSVIGAAILCARARPPGWASFALLAVPVLWLGSVKTQYGILAILQASVDALILLRLWHDLPKACLAAAIGLAGPLIFGSLNSGPGNIMWFAGQINQADVVLQAVLPAATDKAGALRVLGLPPSCAQTIGLSGYNGDVREGRLCPEVRLVSRFGLLPLFARQPGTFIRPITNAIDYSRPALLDNLNPFAQIVGPHPGLSLLANTSLSTLLTYPSKLQYRCLLLCIQAFGCFSLLVLFLKKKGVLPPAGLSMLGLGGLDCLYGVVSAVFGDGYLEPPRHEVFVLVGTAAFSCGLVWCTIAAVKSRHSLNHSKPSLPPNPATAT